MHEMLQLTVGLPEIGLAPGEAVVREGGLAMVSEVLDQLAHRQGPPASPGSARDPNPEY